MREDLRLIREVKSRPYLYHKNLAYTNHKEQREIDWISVGEKLNLSSSVCKTRWRSLRDRFVKALKQVDSPDDLGNLKSWTLLPHLSFLKDHLGKPRKQRPYLDSFDHVSMDEKDDEENYYLPLAETEHKVVSDPVPHDISLDPEFNEYLMSINHQKEDEESSEDGQPHEEEEEEQEMQEDTAAIGGNLFASRHVHFLHVLVEKLDQLSDEECEDVKMDLLNQVHKAVKVRKNRLDKLKSDLRR